MTKPDNSLTELARKRDVQAITAFINQRTLPQGITTKVSLQGDCLQLLLESLEAPEQQEMSTFTRNLLTRLKIDGVYRIKLYGRKQGDEFPAWNVEFEIVSQTGDQTTSNPKSNPKFGGSFQLSSSLPTTPEQEKIAKSKAYEYGISGAILGFIISLPSVWVVLQLLQIQGGEDFAIVYIIGIGTVVFIGYLSGFGQGLTQFEVTCPNCSHKFILFDPGGNCPACSTGLYIDERGNCQVKL